MAISLLTGIVVYVLEHNRIDDYVANLAFEESKRYSEYYSGFYHNPSQASLAILRNALQNTLVHDLFILIEIYDENINKIESNIQTIKSLGNAIAKRDSDTNIHNYRVTLYSVKLAEDLGLSKSHIQSLIKGAFLHDVGKIGISDTILLKPGKLTDDEIEAMRLHVIFGVEIIKNNKWLEDAIDVVLYHHEKFNGTGYPYGFKGKEIPVNARIFTIADYFDALTSSRPYKEAFPLNKSMEILKMGSGSHFDPTFLTKFEQIAKELYEKLSTPEDKQELDELLNVSINKYFTVLD